MTFDPTKFKDDTEFAAFMQKTVNEAIAPLQAQLSEAGVTIKEKDAKIAELVDDDGKAPAAGIGQQMADQRGLSGTKKAGDNINRNCHLRVSFTKTVCPFARSSAAGTTPFTLPC